MERVIRVLEKAGPTAQYELAHLVGVTTKDLSTLLYLLNKERKTVQIVCWSVGPAGPTIPVYGLGAGQDLPYPRVPADPYVGRPGYVGRLYQTDDQGELTVAQDYPNKLNQARLEHINDYIGRLYLLNGMYGPFASFLHAFLEYGERRAQILKAQQEQEEAVLQEVQAISKLRSAGYSWDQVSRELGIPTRRAQLLYKQGLQTRVNHE